MVKRFLAVLITLFTFNSNAWTEKALESSDPFVFSPNNLDISSYELDSTIPYEWAKDSFEWVRVDKKFLIPRARVVFKVPPGTIIEYQNRRFQSRDSSVEVPLVLTNEKSNVLTVKSNPPVTIRVKMKLKADVSPKVIVDPSCSAQPIELKNLKLTHSWGHLFCHAIHPRDGSGYANKVDVDLMWMTEEKEVDTLIESVSISSKLNAYHFDRNGESFDMIAKLPDKFHPLAVSLGLGPYSHKNQNLGFGTLYVAYFFNEGMKLASFTASPFRFDPEVDTGLYLIAEQFRGMDERMVVNLLLGAHVLSFRGGSSSRFYRFSAPQGIEITLRDFAMRGHQLTLGAFYLPNISNRFYSNGWIRYGNPSLFFELNFIGWQEPVGSDTIYTKSFGLSVGMPLLRAL